MLHLDQIFRGCGSNNIFSHPLMLKLKTRLQCQIKTGLIERLTTTRGSSENKLERPRKREKGERERERTPTATHRLERTVEERKRESCPELTYETT